MRITEHISNSFENHWHTGAVFIGIFKAFDKVWHYGLLCKLKIIYDTLTSFLSYRKFPVKINDNISPFQPILTDVPQGSILGLTSFNIYTSPHTNIALLRTILVYHLN